MKPYGNGLGIQTIEPALGVTSAKIEITQKQSLAYQGWYKGSSLILKYCN